MAQEIEEDYTTHTNTSWFPLPLEESPHNLQPLRTSPYIFKVPRELRRNEEKYYNPTMVPIGPLHVSTQTLDSIDRELKKRTLNDLVHRLPQGTTLADVTNLIKQLEGDVRLCYRDDIKISSDELVTMLLLDGCFILMLLIMNESDYDGLFIGLARAKGPLLHNLQQDLLLLENQIPFFVLKALWEVMYPPANGSPHPQYQLATLAFKFFKNIWPRELLGNVLILPEPKHLLDLVLQTLFPRKRLFDIPAGNCTMKNLSELALYGVKVEPNNFANSLVDIRFTNGVLAIPTLIIRQSTLSLFKNLLAFEQCQSEGSSCFTSYLILMDMLVDTEKDVDRLLAAGVMQTRSNDKKALVSLLSDLTVDVDTKHNFYHFGDIYLNVSNYCDLPWPRWRGNFMRHYYESRWHIINAILLFFLTFVQTFFTILSYIHPKN